MGFAPSSGAVVDCSVSSAPTTNTQTYLLSYLLYTFTAESDGVGISKIGQHLAKLRARVGCPVLDSWGNVYQV